MLLIPRMRYLGITDNLKLLEIEEYRDIVKNKKAFELYTLAMCLCYNDEVIDKKINEMQNSEYSFLFDEHVYYKLNVLRQIEKIYKISILNDGSIINNNTEPIEFNEELYNTIKTCFNIYDKPKKEEDNNISCLIPREGKPETFNSVVK